MVLSQFSRGVVLPMEMRHEVISRRPLLGGYQAGTRPVNVSLLAGHCPQSAKVGPRGLFAEYPARSSNAARRFRLSRRPADAVDKTDPLSSFAQWPHAAESGRVTVQDIPFI
jgi:hypothetical protein